MVIPHPLPRNFPFLSNIFFSFLNLSIYNRHKTLVRRFALIYLNSPRSIIMKLLEVCITLHHPSFWLQHLCHKYKAKVSVAILSTVMYVIPPSTTQCFNVISLKLLSWSGTQSLHKLEQQQAKLTLWKPEIFHCEHPGYDTHQLKLCRKRLMWLMIKNET